MLFGASNDDNTLKIPMLLNYQLGNRKKNQ